MNSPQKCAYGLYAEQLSGTAFTAPAHPPSGTWCLPDSAHRSSIPPGIARIELPYWKSAPCVIDPDVISLGQYRWNPVAQRPAAV